MAPNSPDSVGVARSDRRFLVARVAADEPIPADRIVLTIGDRPVAPLSFGREADRRAPYRTTWGDESYYDGGPGTGLLYYRLGDVPEGVDVALAWPGGERPVEGGRRRRLGRPAPPFAATVDAPGEYAGGDAPGVTVVVTNEGDRTGRFLGALNRAGPSIAYTPVARVTGLVDPGGTVRLDVADDWHDPPDGDDRDDGEVDVRYHLRHADGEDTAEIRSVSRE